MSPLQSALAFMSMSLPAQAPMDITEATLVEAQSLISLKDVTEVVLSAVAPNVTLQYVNVGIDS